MSVKKHSETLPISLDDILQNTSLIAQFSAGIGGFLLIWEISIYLFDIPTFLAPAPSEIIIHAIQEWSYFKPHLYSTLLAVFTGLVAGVVFGILSAIGTFYVKFVRRGVYPLLTAVSQVPKVAFVTLLLIWFGTGLVSKTILVLLMVFFPTMLNLFVGLHEIEEEELHLCRLYGVSERFTFRKVRVMRAMPLLLAGLKLSAIGAVVGAIVAEFVAAGSGLGFVIVNASLNYRTVEMFAGILYAITISFTFYGIVRLIEIRFLHWYTE